MRFFVALGLIVVTLDGLEALIYREFVLMPGVLLTIHLALYPAFGFFLSRRGASAATAMQAVVFAALVDVSAGWWLGAIIIFGSTIDVRAFLGISMVRPFLFHTAMGAVGVVVASFARRTRPI